MANIRQGVGRILLEEVTNIESKNICENLKLVQNFVESVKFFPHFADEYQNTRSLKRGKTKTTNDMCCIETERDSEREREESV